jgi:hypothetical protein
MIDALLQNAVSSFSIIVSRLPAGGWGDTSRSD